MKESSRIQEECALHFPNDPAGGGDKRRREMYEEQKVRKIAKPKKQKEMNSSNKEIGAVDISSP